jgi:energy-coupling factor transporter ATP-binding protein EcfA2
MPSWNDFPPDYRAAEVRAIRAAVLAGECVSVVGLSGAGKSNLLGFLNGAQSPGKIACVFVDGNRMRESAPGALLEVMLRALEGGGESKAALALDALDSAINRRLQASAVPLSFLMDLSPVFSRGEGWAGDPAAAGNLRALRDSHKYRLTYVVATRRPLPGPTEFSELFYAHTLWLGPLTESDARWNVARFAERKGLAWDLDSIAPRLMEFSGGYPSFLRAACEACAEGSPPDSDSLAAHPAVRRRLEEFWSDNPTDEELKLAGLDVLPLLNTGRPPHFDTVGLTAKESSLLEYLQTHAGTVCVKDDLIRAVWLEDKILERGVRDDSLAQLVRRLREKIEPDPANPRHILTVSGRGYRFADDSKGGSHA